MDKIFLTNIQRFSLHDGPGIRTTVFLKGCSLRCPWCSNPENLESHQQKYLKDGLEGVYGYYLTPDELYREVIKDAGYFFGELQNWNISDGNLIDKLPGGVTFSGGECLLQMTQLEPLFKNLIKNNIHTCIETSLYTSSKDLELALKYADLFICDVKILNSKKVSIIEKGNLNLFVKNYIRLMESGKPVIIRIPVIGRYTDTEENQDLVCKFLKKIRGNILKIELLKEHNLGLSKYKSLNILDHNFPIAKYFGVEDETLIEYKEKLMKFVDVPIDICKI